MKKLSYFLFLYLFFTALLSAQANRNNEITLKWNDPIVVPINETEKITLLSFENATYDIEISNVPFFNFKIPVSNENIELFIQTYNTENLTTAERGAAIDKSILKTELELEYKISSERGAYFAVGSFMGAVLDGSAVKKITTVTIGTRQGTAKRGSGVSRSGGFYDNAPTVSAMASGQWYKLAIGETGVYRIDFNYLQSIGVNTTNLATSSINIYGNGMGMLPFRNAVPRPDDIQANAIFVNDGGDGIFGPGDFILFYAVGPNRWRYLENTQEFNRSLNQFTDESNYFLVINSGSPKRLQSRSEPVALPSVTFTEFQDYGIHEVDLINVGRTGQIFLGEEFDLVLTRNFNISFPNIVPGSEVKLRANVAGMVQGANSNFARWEFRVNNAVVGTRNSSGLGVGGVPPLYRYDSSLFTFNASSPNIGIQVNFQKNIPADAGRLDKITLTVKRPLTMVGNALFFRNYTFLHPSEVAEYQISDPQNSISQIWEITSPTNAKTVQFTGTTTKTFKSLTNGTNIEYVAISGSNFPSPRFVGTIENQNLHALANVEYIIAAPNRFVNHANELANFHRQRGLTVEVVRLDQVYNEFSSGMRDVTAVRDLLRMLYKRANNNGGTPPKYLLLYGDASYNNKLDNETNTNRVPGWQTFNSWSLVASFITDDYFGFLDDNEGFNNADLLDVGIGRFTVNTLDESRAILNKVFNYGSTNPIAISSIDNTSLFGDWRNRVTFVSDDQNGEPNRIEGHIHMRNTDQLATLVANNHPVFDQEKIYLDAFQQLITPGGERYPQANINIRQAVERGTLLINYVGHGGPIGWAHERVLDVNTIRNWRNFDRLSVFVTATCDFAPFDDPNRISAGEWVLQTENGAGIALFTTTRTVFASQNQNTNLAFFQHALVQEPNGKGKTFGDIARLTKNTPGVVGVSSNHRIFTLLGDPALPINIPKYNIEITTVNSNPVPDVIDTLKAASLATFTGRILDLNNQPKTDVNGFVSITVWDKEQQIATLNNAGSSAGPFLFQDRSSSIFRGQSTVTNGEFTFSFIVPKNINYAIDLGKVTLYFFDGQNDGNGFSKDFNVGGSAEGEITDNIGPEITMYLNNENFIPGGLTNPEPVLRARLFDISGINTVGSGVGQDIVSILNRNNQNATVLNQFYEADLDSYQSGQITYQLGRLEDGPYTLSLRAWDVFNNSSTQEIDFIVADDEEVVLKHVLNYPNPFTTRTEFMFEHNQSDPMLDVRIQIFTISGRLVKSILGTVNSSGFRNEPIVWDGRDDFGDKIGRGVYIYKLRVTNSTGKYAEKLEKLVIIN
ncbi:MAG: type IX secretion system sortase PorU [Luteibaculaceae bacterium]